MADVLEHGGERSDRLAQGKGGHAASTGERTPSASSAPLTHAASGSPHLQVVRWLDSSVQNGQVDKADFPEPCVITSVGWMVKETRDYIVLGRDDMGHDGDFRGLVAIPRVALLPAPFDSGESGV